MRTLRNTRMFPNASSFSPSSSSSQRSFHASKCVHKKNEKCHHIECLWPTEHFMSKSIRRMLRNPIPLASLARRGWGRLPTSCPRQFFNADVKKYVSKRLSSSSSSSSSSSFDDGGLKVTRTYGYRNKYFFYFF